MPPGRDISRLCLSQSIWNQVLHIIKKDIKFNCNIMYSFDLHLCFIDNWIFVVSIYKYTCANISNKNAYPCSQKVLYLSTSNT